MRSAASLLNATKSTDPSQPVVCVNRKSHVTLKRCYLFTQHGSSPRRWLPRVGTDARRRPQGWRIKHRMGRNSIKLYDKGPVLRTKPRSTTR
jgi:hypothetical protein